MLLPITKYVLKPTTPTIDAKNIKSKTRIVENDFPRKNENTKERTKPRIKNTPKASLKKLKLKKGDGIKPLGKNELKSS